MLQPRAGMEETARQGREAGRQGNGLKLAAVFEALSLIDDTELGI